MGRPKYANNKRSGKYAQLVENGWRIVAVRIPPEMNLELTAKAKEKGMSFASYIKNALYWYMRREDAGDVLRKAEGERDD